MADYAMDADALLEALGWDSCRVLGISFGGMVAQEFALRSPRRTKRLVLACTSSGGAGGDSYPLHAFAGLSPRERAQRVIPIRDKRCDAAWQAVNPLQFQKLVDQYVNGLMVGADEAGRDIGARRPLEARMGHNVYNRLPNLRMPLFICGGRHDGISPAANLEAIHRQVPHAHLELFEGKHLFFCRIRAPLNVLQRF